MVGLEGPCFHGSSPHLDPGGSWKDDHVPLARNIAPEAGRHHTMVNMLLSLLPGAGPYRSRWIDAGMAPGKAIAPDIPMGLRTPMGHSKKIDHKEKMSTGSAYRRSWTMGDHGRIRASSAGCTAGLSCPRSCRVARCENRRLGCWSGSCGMHGGGWVGGRSGCFQWRRIEARVGRMRIPATEVFGRCETDTHLVESRREQGGSCGIRSNCRGTGEDRTLDRDAWTTTDAREHDGQRPGRHLPSSLRAMALIGPCLCVLWSNSFC